MAIPLGTLATRQTSGRPRAAASRIECTTTIWARSCVEMKRVLNSHNGPDPGTGTMQNPSLDFHGKPLLTN